MLRPPRTVVERTAQAFEMLLSAIALIVTAPICLVIYVLIKLDSPGPAIFRQKRVGIGGNTFSFYKFRTLYADAKERFPELYAYRYTPEQLDELYFKVENDPRVTRVGTWLRKSTLDELPNFINVLTGEMSLVGPRPEIPEMLPYYDDETKVKFAVLPGVTGLSQVSGRGKLNFRDTVRLDVDYVKNKNLMLDIKILFKTILLTIKRDGAF
jgi:lipopolysaccharide/colanic/teichoic acid biosynthesis glycosyltransferase